MSQRKSVYRLTPEAKQRVIDALCGCPVSQAFQFGVSIPYLTGVLNGRSLINPGTPLVHKLAQFVGEDNPALLIEPHPAIPFEVLEQVEGQ